MASDLSDLSTEAPVATDAFVAPDAPIATVDPNAPMFDESLLATQAKDASQLEAGIDASVLATQAASVEGGAEEREYAAQEDAEQMKTFLFFNAMPSWMISMVFHIVILLALALVQLSNPPPKTIATLSASTTKEDVTSVEEFQITETVEPIDVSTVTASDPVVQTVAAEMPTEVTNVSAATDIDAAPVAIEFTDFGEQTAPKSDLMKSVGAMTGSGLSGRGSPTARAKMVRSAGGTEGSEKAVAMALKWIAEHQLPDGSWNFDHRAGRCQGRCSHQGSMNNCGTGATAMALLPFLGAGQTHKEGEYKANVAAGLAYLVRSMKANGSLVSGGGSMYAHGLASIAVCEAYGMTHDKQLMAPSQAAINFIVAAQDPIGGGWRYQPRQAGDTSAVGWQLMALKSGHMSYLKVPPVTIQGAIRFLDSVQTNSGAGYGYTGPGAGPATSAVGVLCRMYLGWKKDHPGIQRAVAGFAASGPSPSNMYFNYYATQVMRHHEGDEWKSWNEKMREQLVKTQSTEGHMTGSWFMEGGDHGADVGGRLYCTSMATMILEVYYRHMPIYAKGAAEEDFKLK